MDPSLSIVITRSGKSKHSDPSVYNRVNELNNYHHANYNRSNTEASLWCSCKHLVRFKCNSFRRYLRNWHYILCNRRNSRLELGDNYQSSRARRAVGRNNKLYHKLYYYLTLCILAVSYTPVYAEEGDTNNTSNPVAAATGNVTNQAVQFQNNGASSRQIYGPNIQCNGSTMTFSPFYMGSHTNPYSHDEDSRDLYPSSYQLNENWGFQVNFMVPLDKRGYKLCKDIAKRQEEKMRLDYELVRALKCAELMQRGFTFHPRSEMKVVCQDIVPISALQPPKKKKFWQP